MLFGFGVPQPDPSGTYITYPSPGMILQVGGWLSMNWFSIINTNPISSMYVWYYLSTFTKKINQMLVNIPHMDSMGTAKFKLLTRTRSVEL